jgi:hypothetical protein
MVGAHVGEAAVGGSKPSSRRRRRRRRRRRECSKESCVELKGERQQMERSGMYGRDDAGGDEQKGRSANRDAECDGGLVRK